MTEKQNRQLHIALLALVILANLVVRFAGLFTEGLYGDESFSVFHAQQTLPELYERLKFDRNPPFYFFLLHFWIKVFGLKLFYLKGLSALFSVGTAAFIHLFAKRFLNIFTAITASVFFLLSTVQLTLSHELRAFAMVGLLSVMSFYFFLATIQKPKKSNLFALAIVNLLLMFTHYISIFIPIVQFICSLCFRKSNKEGFKYVMYSFIVSAVFYLPWVNIVIKNIPEAGSFWLEIPDLHDLRMVFHNLSGTLRLLILHNTIILGFIIVLVFDKKRQFISKKFKRPYFLMLLLWYVLPVIADFAISHFTPIFRLRYVAYSSLGLFLLLAYIVSSVKVHKAFQILLVAFMLIIPVIRFSPKHIDYEPWEEVISEIKEMKDSNSIVLVSAWYKFREFSYYYNIDFFKDYKTTTYLLSTDSVFLLDDSSAFQIINYKDAERIFFVKSHQSLVDPQFTIDTFLTQHGFSFYESFGEKDLNVSMFYKTELTEYKQIETEAFEGDCSGWEKRLLQNRFYSYTIIEYRNSMEIAPGCPPVWGINPDHSKSGEKSFLINSKNPFSLALQLPVNNSFPTSIEFLFSAFKEKGNKARFVISIEDGDEKLFYKEYFLIEQLNENKKWGQFKKTVSLPLINNKSAIVKFYIWNPDTSDVYIDDLIIRFPMKECPYQVFENLE
jgi:uncharacterized membrane protein